MVASMWRVPASKVGQVGRMSFVQDNGVMRSAVTAGDGFYWFSEVGAGVKPLVLVGTVDEITEFLMNHKTSGINNTVADLPELYMKVAPARKGVRYVGLFPIHDFVSQLVDKLGGFVPGSTLTDIGGALKDLKEAIMDLPTYKKAFSFSKAKSKPLSPNTFAVFWTYTPDKDFVKIGSGKINFSSMYGVIETQLNSLMGI